MRTARAALGSAAFFVVAPGTVAGLVPGMITGWELREPLPYWAVARAAGAILVAAGLVPLVHAFGQFVRAGGTPAPVAPTRTLVVSGFNRYARNPMYIGVVTIILGQSLLFGDLGLALYGLATWVVTATFVRWYEEPTLSAQFGAEYAAYRDAVPAWLPRLHPRATPTGDH